MRVVEIERMGERTIHQRGECGGGTPPADHRRRIALPECCGCTSYRLPDRQRHRCLRDRQHVEQPQPGIGLDRRRHAKIDEPFGQGARGGQRLIIFSAMCCPARIGAWRRASPGSTQVSMQAISAS